LANHKSAKKRARQTITRTLRASQSKKSVRTSEKTLRVAIDAKKSDEASTLFKSYAKQLAKATQKGYYHLNAMARKVSRLSEQIANISK
jgi:small subunit ribosomal protein S20